MRELRTCPVTGVQVLLNEGWVDQPAAPASSDPCWYCPQPGPTIESDGHVRVTPHPVPALGIEGDPRVIHEDGRTRRDALGAHELIHAEHDAPDAPLLRMVAARMAALRNDGRLRGFRAVRRHRKGTHTVWQLLALPYDVAPTAAAAWRDRELRLGQRVVARGHASAVLAWAPRVPFETWVVPSAGAEPFPHALDAMAEALRLALARLDAALGGPPIDVVLEDGAPWRIVLLPRLRADNAVEVATGLPMHGVFPEAAARFLMGSNPAG